MKLFAVRHGQAEHNVRWLLNDNPSQPSDLTQKGRAQAEIVGRQLKTVKLGRIYTSELPRTHQTAEIINRYLKLPILVEPRLNEIKTGYGGQPVWRWLFRQLLGRLRTDQRPSGGESLDEAMARINSFIADLRRQKLAENILIVAHQHTLQTLDALFNGTAYATALRRPISHTKVLEFDLD